MTTNNSALDLRVGGTEELGGSERFSEDKNTPGGTSDASATANDPTGGVIAQRAHSSLVRATTRKYLDDEVDPTNPPNPQTIVDELLKRVNEDIEVVNAGQPKAAQLPFLKDVAFYQVAMILTHLHHMVKIGGTNNADPDLLPLGMYDEAEGIYVTSEDSIRAVAREYLPSITDREFKEAMKAVRDTVPVRQRSMHPDLIAVNNGIFDFSSKELRPFDPEMIFISKSRVAYDANAESPRITMPDGQVWEFDAWLLDLMDDDEDMAELIREILSAILRPHVSWDKSAWFYSTKGNNGKGTLVALMRELLGAQSYASIPLADFGKEFVLEPLMRAQAILVDENDVGVFIDKAANLKAVQTNDSIFINRKHKIPVTYQFYGFMVQCINEQPMVKDKSESFYRRQLFVPFTKSFTGAERRYIKHDYLKRPEVLQYVLKLALHMEHYALSEPKPVVEAMEAYKLHNDPVRSFWKEFEPRLQWDLLPSTFLYALFKAWFERSNPKGSVISRNSFLDRLREVALPQGRWEWTDNTRSKGRMEDPEELIVEYNLVDWMSRTYTGNDPTKRSLPLLNPGYAGLKLVGTKLTLVQDDEDDVA